MNKQKLIASIKQDFMLKRIKAEEKAEEFLNSLKQNPEFNNIYNQFTTKQLQYLKSKYDKENLQLKQEAEELKTKLECYMSKLNLDFSALQPKYDCKICMDTGVVDGKICSCLLTALNKKLSLATSSQSIFKSFEDCNLNIMNEDDKRACNWLKTWCKSYPKISKININILGGAGLGKTFLLECIATEMIKQGALVCFKTAFELNELARLYHMGKSYEFSDCIDADILLIDDLGTEPVLKNVTKEYLYNLINLRQVKKRPTIITSNLSLNNILERYDDRIFSRLGNEVLATQIVLTSSDKRINK